MGTFDRQIETAKRLIAKNGQTVTFRQLADTVGDRPWKTTQNAPVDNPVKICFLPITKEYYETFVPMRDSEVPTGSVMGLMGQVAFNPSLKDIVIRDGKQLNIESIDLLSPNGEKILYTIIFKE